HATRLYNGPYGNRCLFMGLSHAIQDHFVQRRAPYPIERTLLTTGLTDAVMISRAEKNRRVETPYLDIRYQPTEWGFAVDPLPRPIKR
ncbi:MAG: hypothetical protein HYR84_14960, partial [Planctomycetes bacterium]|nr:hypothetical protein [Planctomycetota bacterium]